MQRVIAVGVLICTVSVCSFAALVHQSASVNTDQPEGDSIVIDYSLLSSAQEFLYTTVTMNGHTGSAPASVTVTFGGAELSAPFDGVARSFPNECGLLNPCQFAVTADPASNLVTVRNISRDWTEFRHSLITLASGENSTYQLDVDVSGATSDPDRVHVRKPARKLAANPEAGVLRFPPATLAGAVTITPLVPDTDSFDRLELYLRLFDGGIEYDPQNVEVYAMGVDLSDVPGTGGLNAQLAQVPDGGHLLTITGDMVDADWSLIDRVDIVPEPGDLGQTFSMDISIRAYDTAAGTDPVRPPGLAIWAVEPRDQVADPTPPTLVGWQDEPLTDSATMALLFRTDRITPFLMVDHQPEAGFSVTINPDGDVDLVAASAGQTTVTIDDPVSGGLVLHDMQVTSWIVGSNAVNPVAPPSNLRLRTDTSQDGDPSNDDPVGTIATNPNTYPVSAIVGTYMDGVLEITNVGGGFVRIHRAVVTPGDYLWQDHGGYFAATFQSESPFPDPGSPDTLEVEFESVLEPGTPIDVGHNQTAYLEIRYVPVRGDLDPEQWDLVVEYTGHANPAHTASGTAVQIGDLTELPVRIETEALSPSPRDPFDFLAVLDKSGSMSGPAAYPIDVAFPSKILGLNAAGELLFRVMDTIGTPEDRTGVIVYDRDAQSPLTLGSLNATPPNPPPGTFVYPYVGAAAEEAASIEANGSTSMSDALAMAVEQLHGSPVGPPERTRSILLMTDGRHNTGADNARSNVAALPTDFEMALAPPAADVESLIASTQMFVVGLGGNGGQLAAPELKLLADGWQGNGAGAPLVHRFARGGYRQSLNIDSLGIHFAQILAGNFFEAQIPNDDPATIPLGRNVDLPVAINSSTTSAIFYVTWTDPRVRVTFELRDPTGNGHKALPGRGYAYFPIRDMTEFAARYPDGPGGDWIMSVSADPVSRDVDPPESVAIEYAAFVTDPVIHADFRAHGTVAGTGDTVVLTATLTEGGAPIRGADCFALVTVPKEGLGEFLFENADSVDGPTDPPADSQATDAVQLLDAILEGDAEGIERVTVRLRMRDDGAEGDTAPGDGIYTLAVSDEGEVTTEHNGVYHYRFLVEGETLSGQRFERTTALSGYTTSVADPADTETTVYVRNPTTAYVSIEARDRFGHRVDPIASRTYVISSARPDQLQFDAARESRPYDGSVVYRLTASTGTFSLAEDPDRQLRVEAVPVAPTLGEVNLPPALPAASLAIDIIGGYQTALSGAGVPSTAVVGFRGWWNPGRSLLVEAEIAGGNTQVPQSEGFLQYGMNIGMRLPTLIGSVRPYASVAIGGVSYFGPTSDTTLQTGVGIGGRWYTDWEMNESLVGEGRVLLQLDPQGQGLTTLIQILFGWRLGSTN